MSRILLFYIASKHSELDHSKAIEVQQATVNCIKNKHSMRCINRIASCPNKLALVVLRLVALVLVMIPIELPELTTARGAAAGSFGAGDDTDRAARTNYCSWCCGW